MKSYKKYWEYKITLASASDDKLTRELFDPRINPYCVCSDHYIANMRFRKNLNRPNRVRNVKYTLECWNRHLQKKKGNKTYGKISERFGESSVCCGLCFWLVLCDGQKTVCIVRKVDT